MHTVNIHETIYILRAHTHIKKQPNHKNSNIMQTPIHLTQHRAEFDGR